MRKGTKSLYDWCIENERQDILDLWDYILNECSPKDVGYSSNRKYWFKCPRGIHKSELKNLNRITSGISSLKCAMCNSFGQYLIDVYGEDALKRYWDYEKNKVNPFEVTKCCAKKVWLFCQEKPYHGSYEIRCSDFYNKRRCPYCRSFKVHKKDSFGQWLIDTYGKDALEKYWDYEKNKVNPFELCKNSDKKIWMKCRDTNYHGSYEMKCYSFYRGQRCPYCSHKGKHFHSKDSFAQYHIDNTDPNFLEKYWSEKNTIDPFSIQPHSNKTRVWIKCQKDEEHGDYEVTCNNFTKGNRCGKCSESKGERKIREYLCIHNINFVAQKAFPNLLGVNEGSLTYDFYIPNQNLLIEYQGSYHDGTAKNQTEEDYIKQQEHDKRKKEYAKQRNIRLLEIWYWDFKNIEEILNKNIK